MSWVEETLQNALDSWNDKLSDILSLLQTSPQSYGGGGVWNVITSIRNGIEGIGIGLLVLFFVIGVLKTCVNFDQVKRPEQALKLFIRFAVAKGMVTYGMEIMSALFDVGQGVINTVISRSGLGSMTEMTLPDEVKTAIDDVGFMDKVPLWAVSLIGSLIIIVLSFIVVLTVYGRFFKLYIYTAISPIPLSTFAGEPTQRIGFSFLRSYAGVCLEGAVIILACVIFSAFATGAPTVNTDADSVTIVMSYIVQLVFNMLLLTGTVRMADRIIKEMLGL